MDTNHAFKTPDEYAHWINQRIGEEVRRRREALGLSAYALGKLAGVSDQTILNIERGSNGQSNSVVRWQRLSPFKP